MNPRPPECKSADWEAFRTWLRKTHARRNANDLLRVARKYHRILWEPSEASQLLNLSDSNRRLTMAALANLSKFLGMYKVWKGIVKDSGLKWSSGRSEDLIIQRLAKAQNTDHIVDWVRSVKDAVPALSVFVDFTVASGIRFVESVSSFNLIIDLSRQGHLSQYYTAERALLEHYKFKDLFIRRGKKVFISFVPRDMIAAVQECSQFTSDAISSRIKRAKLSSRFGDIREFWASYMTKHLRQSEIDFLQGRISASVFMRNYFNPAWITDLKQRTLKGTADILAKIN